VVAVRAAVIGKDQRRDRTDGRLGRASRLLHTVQRGDRGEGPGHLLPVVPHTFGQGRSAESKRQAIAQANEHCAKSGKMAKVTNEELGPVTADIFFTCIAK